MGLVYADLELINVKDQLKFEDSLIEKKEIRKINIKALVDTGAYLMCINENIKTQLGLTKRDERVAKMADGTIKKLELVGPIEIVFKNRKTITNAIVLPGDNEALLGAIPMEDLDVTIDVRKQEIDVNPDHPNYAVTILK